MPIGVGDQEAGLGDLRPDRHRGNQRRGRVVGPVGDQHVWLGADLQVVRGIRGLPRPADAGPRQLLREEPGKVRRLACQGGVVGGQRRIVVLRSVVGAENGTELAGTANV